MGVLGDTKKTWFVSCWYPFESHSNTVAVRSKTHTAPGTRAAPGAERESALPRGSGAGSTGSVPAEGFSWRWLKKSFVGGTTKTAPLGIWSRGKSSWGVLVGVLVVSLSSSPPNAQAHTPYILGWGLSQFWDSGQFRHNIGSPWQTMRGTQKRT